MYIIIPDVIDNNQKLLRAQQTYHLDPVQSSVEFENGIEIKNILYKHKVFAQITFFETSNMYEVTFEHNVQI